MLHVNSALSLLKLGLDFHAGSLTAPSNAFMPQGTCELAKNVAVSGFTSAAKDAASFALWSRDCECEGTSGPGGG
jgi:hypothetical protein